MGEALTNLRPEFAPRPRRRLPIGALVTGLVCVATTALANEAAPKDRHHRVKEQADHGRIILPSAGPAMSAAFDRVKEHVPKVDVAIARTTAVGKACKADTCWAFRLTDPEHPCAGVKSAAFCLTWTGDVPPPSIVAPLATALSDVDPDKVWRDPPDRPASANMQLATAILLLFGPLFLGWLMGTGLKKAAPNHPGIRTLASLLACVGLAVAALLMALKDQAHPAPADAVFTASLLFGGLWFGGLPATDPRLKKLAIIGSLVGLIVAEFALRGAIANPPECWHGGEIKLLLPADSDRKCRGAFEGRDQAWFDRIMRRARGGDEHVLHVGDSMVFGSGVQANETFVSQLDNTDATIAHVNASSPDVGPAHYLLIVRRWLATHTGPIAPRHVVVYIYPGNDLVDIDRPDPCCGGASLLQYTDGKATSRCKHAHWQPDVALSLLQSPPPYAVQVAAHYTWGGAMVCAAAKPVAAHLGQVAGLLPSSPDGAPNAKDHLAAVFSALKLETAAVGAKLTIVVLPEREGLEGAVPANTPARRRSTTVTELARAAGIETVDLWKPLQTVVARDGPQPWFANTYARDYHLSRRGHQLVARHIGPLVGAPKPVKP